MGFFVTEPKLEPALEDDQGSTPLSRWIDLEHLVSARLFPRLGVAIVVVGMVFLMAYTLGMLPAWGKVLLGAMAGFAILGTGLWAEQRAAYRLLGRALISGGWALLYLVAFASHFVPAARVMPALPALASMATVAAAATIFSLRYRHQTTTIAALGLMLSALVWASVVVPAAVIQGGTVFVAAAAALLAWRLGWNRLLLVGLAACWLALGLSWRPGGSLVGPLTSVMFVWALFAWPLGRPRPATNMPNHLCVPAWFANVAAALLLGLLVATTTAPSLAWTVPAVLAVGHVIAAWQAGARKGFNTGLLASAFILGVLALPMGLGVASLFAACCRLVLVAALLLAGVYLGRKPLRLLASATLLFTMGELLARALLPGLNLTLGAGSPLLVRFLSLSLGLFAGMAALLLVETRWRQRMDPAEQRWLPAALAGATTMLAGAAGWIMLPAPWLGAALAALGLAWLVANRRWHAAYLQPLGAITLLAAMAAALSLGLVGTALPSRWLTLGLPLTGAWVAYILALHPVDNSTGTAIRARVWSGAAVLLSLCLLAAEVSDARLAIILAIGGLLLQWVARRGRRSELLVESWVLTGLGLLVTFGNILDLASGRPALPAWLLITPLLPILATGYGLVQYFRVPTTGLDGRSRQLVRWLFGLAIGGLLVTMFCLELPGAYAAMACAALTLAAVAAERRLALPDLLATAALAAGVSLVQILLWGAAPQAGWPMAVTVLLLGGCWFVARLLPEQGTRAIWQRSLAAAVGAMVLLLLIAWHVPALAVFPLMGLAALGLLWAGLRWKLAELFVMGLLWQVPMLLGLLTVTWSLPGSMWGLSWRLWSVAGGLPAMFLSQHLLRRHAGRGHGIWPLIGGATAQRVVAAVYLAVPTLIMAVLLETHALALGVLAVVYHERARAIASRAWLLLGQGLWAAGALHLLLVTLWSIGGVGPFSLRLLISLLFAGLTIYLYRGWRAVAIDCDLADKWQSLRLVHFALLVILAGILLALELPLHWVLVGLAGLGLVLIVIWRGAKKATPRGWHWRAAAQVVALCAVAQGLAANLTVSGSLWSLPMHLLTVWIAVAMLLVGYVLLRRAPTSQSSWLGGHRLLLLAAALLLGNVYIWVQAWGMPYTVWLSLEGLGLVLLGITVRERWARMLGVGLLSVCVIKLFFYDLASLEGLPRIVSFIVLGAVLIVVSVFYSQASPTRSSRLR